MHMAEEQSHPDWGSDYRGKAVVVSTHLVVDHVEQVRGDLREFMTKENGRFKVNGFVLGKLVDVSIHGQFWVEFPWTESPVRIKHDLVLKVLLDDEGEPDFVHGLPRLV